MFLSKADLISGKDNIQEVKIESLNDTIFLRPLTRGEWDKIEEIETASMGKFTTTEKQWAVAEDQDKKVAWNHKVKLMFMQQQKQVKKHNHKQFYTV